MGGQELFTELKNLAVLPRYGSSKLAPTRAISRAYRDCIGILPKIGFEKDMFFQLSSFGPRNPILWLLLALRQAKNSIGADF